MRQYILAFVPVFLILLLVGFLIPHIATHADIDRLSAQIAELKAQEPEVIYVTNNVTIIREEPVEVERVVNGRVQNFPSLEELAGWLDQHLTTMWGGGDRVPDCDDYAERMVREAHEDGWLLHIQLINDGLLNGVQVSDKLEPHAGIIALVDNQIYFIEPQPKYFRIVFVCNRD
jgi:hypothetical protein